MVILTLVEFDPNGNDRSQFSSGIGLKQGKDFASLLKVSNKILNGDGYVSCYVICNLFNYFDNGLNVFKKMDETVD